MSTQSQPVGLVPFQHPKASGGSELLGVLALCALAMQGRMGPKAQDSPRLPWSALAQTNTPTAPLTRVPQQQRAHTGAQGTQRTQTEPGPSSGPAEGGHG